LKRLAALKFLLLAASSAAGINTAKGPLILVYLAKTFASFASAMYELSGASSPLRHIYTQNSSQLIYPLAFPNKAVWKIKSVL
jgi:hypothetical protein